MSDPKNTGKPSSTGPSEESFDDLEDAFFASGDASSFWENGEAPDGDVKVAEETPQKEDIDPLELPSTSIAEPTPSEDSTEQEADSQAAAPPVEAVGDPTGEFYNPSALHPHPDLIADDETAVLSDEEAASALREAGPLGSEAEDPASDGEPAPVEEAAPIAAAEEPSPVLEQIDPNQPYEPPATVDEAWTQAARSLEREAQDAKKADVAGLLSEAGRIQLGRAGQWEDAGRLFDAAMSAGLSPGDAPKGYADVIASQGRFSDLRNVLVARAERLNGAAAVEALQDAAIVERNHLNNEPAAVSLLERALELRDDWFTLRLLRELHYRTQDWGKLVDVLDRMSKLGSGARSARCKVEEGRIRETEMEDLPGASKAYQEAQVFDPSFMDALLARQRVARSQKDFEALGVLYAQEANKTAGEDACFWWLRAARAASSHEPNQAEEWFKKAMDVAGDSNLSVYRESEAWFRKTDRRAAMVDAIRQEAAMQSGQGKASTLMFLGQLAGQDSDLDTSIRADMRNALEADPSCGPAAELLVFLLVRAGEGKEAIEVLAASAERAVEGAARAEVWFRSGEIAELINKEPAAAAELYGRALAQNDKHAFAARSMARCFVQSGDYQQAIDALQCLVDGANDADVASRIWHQISQIHRHHLGDEDAADTAAQLSFEASAVQPAAMDAWIDSLGRRGDPAALAEGLATMSQALPNPRERIDAAYRGARILVDVCGDPGRARPLLQRCVELDPHCGAALSLLRFTCGLTGDWAAVYDLRRIEAAQAEPGEHMWHLLAAAQATSFVDGLDPQTVALEIIGEQKDHSGALAALERAALDSADAHRLVGVYRRMRSADEDPGARTAYSVRLADIASTARDRQLAIRSITRVLEASVGPRPYAVMARLAVELEAWALAEAALHAHGDTVGLARLLEATSDDQKRIAASWRSIAKKDPENVEAHGGLERSLSRMGSREGLAETHGALARYEKDTTISTMHALLAGHLFENEDVPESALEYYGRAFEQSPYRGKAFDALVRIRGERGESQIIGELFGTLNIEDPLARADAMHDAGAHDVALQIYTEAVAAIPETPGAQDLPILVRYEQALATSEQWPEVFEVLSRRHAVSVNDSEGVLIEAKRRWVLSERMADSDEAWNFYRALHEEQPEDRDVLENLARIAGARGERELAIQFLDGLSNIAPTADDAARYQRRIAEVHLANGASTDARASYLRALDHLPEDLDSMTGLKVLAREEEDWQALVGILSREAQIKQGADLEALVREIAELWEVKLEDGAVAIDAWRRVLELVPSDQTALQHLVDLAAAHGDWASFIDDGRALVHYLDGKSRSDLLAQMGRAAMQHLRREDEAIRLLDEASTGSPPNLQAAEDLEQIHAARGSWDLVVECTLRRARGSEGDEAVSLYLQAARSRRDHLRDRKGAAAAYEEALSISEDQPEALQYLGYYRFENNDLTGSVFYFERIEKLDVDVDLEDFDVQMEQALYYFRFGEALRRLDRRDESIRRYEQALDLNASHLPTLEAVGPLYVDTMDWESASRVFRQILQLTGGQGDPDRLARVYSCLGTVEHAQGNTEKAVRRYKKALELQPNDIGALRGYSCVLYAQKDWNNLLNTYNNIIYHAKEKVAFIDAYLMKGFVLDVHMSLADKAAQHYEKSLSFDASHPVALLRLAELALRKDDWDRALSYAGRALSVGGEATDVVRGQLMLIQAISYVATDRPEEGQAALESAQTLSPGAKEMGQAGIGDGAAIHAALRQGLQAGL